MCPTCDASQQGVPNGTPAIPTSQNPPAINGTSSASNGLTNGSGSGHAQEHTPHNPRRQPFASVGDYLSNVSNFSIIESTLREGEQFANAFFDTDTKVRIAKALDAFGVEYIELTNPTSSEQSRKDCEIICKLGLKAKILTHVRCHMDDAKLAVETGVDGLDLVIGTSPQLMQHSHGKTMDYIRETALEVISFVKSKGLEVRFSSEDSFRSDLVDLLNIYSAVDRIGGVNRVGIADTIGVANPRQVYDLVRTLRGCVHCDIETHMHNDTGCAIANSLCALEAGATHVDTSVLGIGERNGITPLGGFVARMLTLDRDYVRSKYDLAKLKPLEDLVASAVEINIPFNNPVTGFCAFTHKAGIHAKAILANPTTYEIINPADFGMTRYVHFASRLTGWNAIKSRVEQLGLVMTDSQIKQCTAKIKAMADVRHLAIEDIDKKHQFQVKEQEMAAEPEARELDHVVEEQTKVLNGVVGEVDGREEKVEALNGEGVVVNGTA
ncbi:MAG: homocitrate synthase lys21 [Ramalina farinacea]|uniref:homocitrate synthase n=1 Tax=Ramalina farinacea TaxID=258253 RepID=A0AA43QMN8_9LECA|nr:homocitrate synthase lys21 [Ramalina farinacea]